MSPPLPVVNKILVWPPKGKILGIPGGFASRSKIGAAPEGALVISPTNVTDAAPSNMEQVLARVCNLSSSPQRHSSAGPWFSLSLGRPIRVNKIN